MDAKNEEAVLALGAILAGRLALHLVLAPSAVTHVMEASSIYAFEPARIEIPTGGGWQAFEPTSEAWEA